MREKIFVRTEQSHSLSESSTTPSFLGYFNADFSSFPLRLRYYMAGCIIPACTVHRYDVVIREDRRRGALSVRNLLDKHGPLLHTGNADNTGSLVSL